MNPSTSLCRPVLGIIIVLILTGTGCEGEPRPRSADSGREPRKTVHMNSVEKPSPTKAPAAAEQPGQPGSGKKVALGNEVWFETEGNRRRVLVGAAVCLREGGLECLLCRSHTKEYESILATDADAQVIHAALLAAGAKAGSPVQYVEKNGEVVIVPPAGSCIKISIRYEDKGKLTTVPAQQWIRNAKTNKDLEDEWVFAGSKLLPPEGENNKPVYAATSDGSYICIYNMPYALLDLSVNNPNKDPEVRELQPQTGRIPPLETKVTLILEPQTNDKKADK
jgi:hypothetical protein